MLEDQDGDLYPDAFEQYLAGKGWSKTNDENWVMLSPDGRHQVRLRTLLELQNAYRLVADWEDRKASELFVDVSKVALAAQLEKLAAAQPKPTYRPYTRTQLVQIVAISLMTVEAQLQEHIDSFVEEPSDDSPLNAAEAIQSLDSLTDEMEAWLGWQLSITYAQIDGDGDGMATSEAIDALPTLRTRWAIYGDWFKAVVQLGKRSALRIASVDLEVQKNAEAFVDYTFPGYLEATQEE